MAVQNVKSVDDFKQIFLLMVCHKPQNLVVIVLKVGYSPLYIIMNSLMHNH